MSKSEQFTLIGPNAATIAGRAFTNSTLTETLNTMASEIQQLRKALEYYAKTWPLELELEDWTYVHGCKEWGVVARRALGDEFQ